jgi:hypothetical protein
MPAGIPVKPKWATGLLNGVLDFKPRNATRTLPVVIRIDNMILLLVIFWFGLREMDFDNVKDLRVSAVLVAPLFLRDLPGRSCADGSDPRTKAATDDFTSGDTSTRRRLSRIGQADDGLAVTHLHTSY